MEEEYNRLFFILDETVLNFVILDIFYQNSYILIKYRCIEISRMLY